MSRKRFPIQDGPSVPWEFMVPHEAQHKLNHGGQTLERMAQRGGLGATEAWCCVNGLKLWPTHDTDEGIANARQGWLELAERVNREWSTKRLLADERTDVVGEILAFNTQIGCTPQEGYKDLTDAATRKAGELKDPPRVRKVASEYVDYDDRVAKVRDIPQAKRQAYLDVLAALK